MSSDKLAHARAAYAMLEYAPESCDTDADWEHWLSLAPQCGALRALQLYFDALTLPSHSAASWSSAPPPPLGLATSTSQAAPPFAPPLPESLLSCSLASTLSDDGQGQGRSLRGREFVLAVLQRAIKEPLIDKFIISAILAQDQAATEMDTASSSSSSDWFKPAGLEVAVVDKQLHDPELFSKRARTARCWRPALQFLLELVRLPGLARQLKKARKRRERALFDQLSELSTPMLDISRTQDQQRVRHWLAESPEWERILEVLPPKLDVKSPPLSTLIDDCVRDIIWRTYECSDARYLVRMLKTFTDDPAQNDLVLRPPPASYKARQIVADYARHLRYDTQVSKEALTVKKGRGILETLQRVYLHPTKAKRLSNAPPTAGPKKTRFTSPLSSGDRA